VHLGISRCWGGGVGRGFEGRSDLGKDLGHAKHNSCAPMNKSKDRRRSTFVHEQHSETVKNLARCWTAEYFHLVVRHSPQRGGGGPSVREDVEPKPWNLDPCEGWETYRVVVVAEDMRLLSSIGQTAFPRSQSRWVNRGGRRRGASRTF
jgi:hypothetical protein